MIRIIAGVYGHNENGIITPKNSDSAPFSLTPEREAELVAQGVAAYANVIIPEDDSQTDMDLDDEDPDGDGQSDTVLDDEDPDGDSQSDTVLDDEDPDGDGQSKKPEYSEKMKLPELQALAASFGLNAEKMRAKAEVVKLLDDYFSDEDDGEQPPSFGAINPVEQ